jgi:hypothetical protein
MQIEVSKKQENEVKRAKLKQEAQIMAARRESIKRIIIDNDNEREIKSESLYSVVKTL